MPVEIFWLAYYFLNLEIRVIMDFVPNHTSDQHLWFIKSCKEGEDNPYKDFYIWKDGKLNEKDGSIEPPNNWVSIIYQCICFK